MDGTISKGFKLWIRDYIGECSPDQAIERALGSKWCIINCDLGSLESIILWDSYALLLNKHCSGYRETLAHDLVHILLHSSIRWGDSVFHEQEIEAKAGVAEILLPYYWFTKRILPRIMMGESYTDISSEIGVSIELLRQRIDEMQSPSSLILEGTV